MIVVGLLGASDAAIVGAIARRAASIGSKVEVVGLLPGDATSDRVLFELTAAGVGHATVVRSARVTMEPADLDLALRYLPDIRSVVLVRPSARLLATALAGVDFVGASLLIVGPLDADATAELAVLATTPAGQGSAPARASSGPEPIVLDSPTPDRDGTFAGFVATLAARLDAGDRPDAAFQATVAALAVDVVDD